MKLFTKFKVQDFIIPGLFFSLYAGALSDEFGRKPLMMIPIFGFFVSAICGIINYAFVRINWIRSDELINLI